MPLIRELTSLLGYPVRSQRGIEADDLIGSAARILVEQGHEVVIVSADKDLAQCVGGNVTQLLPAPTANPRIGWRKLDAEGVTEKFFPFPTVQLMERWWPSKRQPQVESTEGLPKIEMK